MHTRIARVLWSTLLVAGSCYACAQDQNVLPKYGSLPKSDALKASDEVFIKGMDEEYHGDRAKASTYMAMRGWQYLTQGDLETAMRRFNQAWLLNNNNGVALWGMAAAQASLGKSDDSLKLFTEAEKSMGTDLNFTIDHAKAIGMAGASNRDDALLRDAYKRFQSIYERAPQNTLNLENWAMTLFKAGRYPEAWEKVNLAEAVPGKNNVDPAFVSELASHMPRPVK